MTDVHDFMKARQRRLLAVVVSVTKNAAPTKVEAAEEGDDVPTAIAQDSGLEFIEAD